MPNLGEILKSKLPEDVMSQITDAMGDDYDWDVVPRTRLNKVIAERNKYKNQIDNGDNGGEGSQGVDLSGYVKKEDVEDQLKKAAADSKKAHEAELLSLRKRYSAIDGLRKENAINPDLILNGGLIDISKMDFDDKGVLTGFDEAVKGLKKDSAYLFGSNVPKGTGREGDGNDGEDGDALTSKINGVFEQLGISMSDSQEG